MIDGFQQEGKFCRLCHKEHGIYSVWVNDDIPEDEWEGIYPYNVYLCDVCISIINTLARKMARNIVREMCNGKG